MTVIAYDGKSLAADRQITTGSVIEGFQKKIYEWSRGVWSSAGRVDDAEAFRKWLDSREKTKLHKSFHGIYSEDGEVWEVYSNLVPFKATPGTGLGDGGQLATAFMGEGYTAEEAVKAVCKYNIYCGGKVDVVDV